MGRKKDGTLLSNGQIVLMDETTETYRTVVSQARKALNRLVTDPEDKELFLSMIGLDEAEG